MSQERCCTWTAALTTGSGSAGLGNPSHPRKCPDPDDTIGRLDNVECIALLSAHHAVNQTAGEMANLDLWLGCCR